MPTWVGAREVPARIGGGVRDFAELNQVKIAWTLEVRSRGAAPTDVATETRAVATDEQARSRFLRYWRWARFGILLIRRRMLRSIRREAEARWRERRLTDSAP